MLNGQCMCYCLIVGKNVYNNEHVAIKLVSCLMFVLSSSQVHKILVFVSIARESRAICRMFEPCPRSELITSSHNSFQAMFHCHMMMMNCSAVTVSIFRFAVGFCRLFNKNRGSRSVSFFMVV